MLKKSAVLGLAILVTGAAVFGWVFTEERKEQQLVATYKQKYSSEPEEYLKQHNDWLQLNAEGQIQPPWGVDEYGRAKTKAQLRQEQSERLRADMERLACGETNCYPFTDILYGENWRAELKKYKARRARMELIFTSSIFFMAIGGAILSWCVLLGTARLTIKVSRLFGKSLAYIFRRLRERKHEKELQEDIKEQVEEGKADEQQKLKKQARESKRYSEVLVDSGWCSFNNNEKGSQDALMDYEEKSSKTEESFKTQTEQLEKQLAEFGKMTKSVQQATLNNSEPINNTLTELAEQVAAIREYACRQQDRVTKLQDGYDWNIIRTFCLRIIRCIDNIENRIKQLSKQGVDTTDLEEVRDELVFGLESSGVEQFEPEINSDYRGQEKTAEAVKDRQHCDEPHLAGKIAKVIRRGYQYVIDEGNVKVVRAAQVKLFGQLKKTKKRV